MLKGLQVAGCRLKVWTFKHIASSCFMLSAFSFPPSAFRLPLFAFRFPPYAFHLTLFAFTFLLSASTFSAKAQKVTWDSVSRPEIYGPQLEQYRTFKRSKNDIVFLGNSITHWTNWNELLNIKNGKNRGIPGDVTYGVIDRMDEALLGSPKKIFILIGINDVARNVPDEVILANYQRIITIIKNTSPRTKIYFQTMLPTNPSFKKLPNHYKNDHVVNINAGLKQLGIKNNITIIDLYAAFIDEQQLLKKEYTYDGVHLTGKGYQVWADLLKKGNYLKD